MNVQLRAAAIVAFAALAPGLASAQAPTPGTRPDLDRRVFVDVNRVAPGKVLDQLAASIACSLDVDRDLPQPDISLTLSNVRARTALDAVCDMVGCRWSLKGTVLVVSATSPSPPVPPGQRWIEKLKAPLAGRQWKLDRVPLREVLARLSDDLGAEVVWDGPDPGTPVTDDLRGRPAVEALDRIQGVVGCDLAGGSMRMDVGRDRPQIRLEGCKNAEPRRRPAPASTRVYDPGTPGLTLPVPTNEVRPHYTREAMQAKIQGSVVVSCVVGVDGSVSDATVEQALDPVLDQQALAAARQWRFNPGTKDGKPVPVRISLELTFTLR